ncbi:MAG: transposase [Paenibacillus sp.]|jgi:hypothetical protein|nr:transposase [Paenibacillus sp.]
MVKWKYLYDPNYLFARCIFMDLQLEPLPYHFYNTLGFDAEHIDYVDCTLYFL